jgi:hypothetical protein
MVERTFLDSGSPVTQTIEAVTALLTWCKMPTEPMPITVELPGGNVVLVQSSKKDCYYTTTARDCSCPAKAFHPNKRCKHMLRHFPISKEMLIDAAIGETTAGEIEYWQKKDSRNGLELMQTAGFRPVPEGE